MRLIASMTLDLQEKRMNVIILLKRNERD